MVEEGAYRCARRTCSRRLRYAALVLSVDGGVDVESLVMATVQLRKPGMPEIQKLGIRYDPSSFPSLHYVQSKV